MNSVGVLGLGNWGTALANHLACKGCDVLGWSIEENVVEGINRNHLNPLYLAAANLNSNFRATCHLEEVLMRPIQLVVLPSHVLSKVVPRIRVQAGTIIVSAVKGLEVESSFTPLQYMASYLPPSCPLVVISGPSFARDVVVRRPCGLVAASTNDSAAKEVAELLTSETMRIYLSRDPLGVELGGIVKNVIALAVGFCDGIGLGDSARAGLITRGLAEMMRLAAAMGADTRTISGLSGLGDLVMTATCDTSRNRTVGLRLGRGETLETILASLGSVAEGVATAPAVQKLAERFQVEMPITFVVNKFLRGEIVPQEAVKYLLLRPIRKEFE